MAKRKLVYGSIIAFLGIVLGFLGELFPDKLKAKMAAAFPFAVTYEAAWTLVVLLVVVILLVIVWKYEGAEQPPATPPMERPNLPATQPEQTPLAINPNPALAKFKTSMLEEIDRKSFAAVPDVLRQIAASPYHYDKPTFAGLQSDAVTLLAGLSSNQYITRLQNFIHTLT